jgi:hypothetical protein
LDGAREENRPLLSTLTRPVLGTLLGAVGIVLTVVLACGGAAADGAGMWLGVPGGSALVLAAVALALAWGLPGCRGRLGLAAGVLVVAAPVLAGLPLAGARALSGPPIAALAVAGLALVLAAAQLRVRRALFLPMAFAALVTAAGRNHVVVGPEGDEPHYLMVAQSLLLDHDLSLERDYALGRYTLYHDAPLAPHYRVRGRGGEIYSIHAVGLSILILPAWALAGYAGVTVFMALLAALVAGEVRAWVRELTSREGVAEAAGWLAVLTPPIVHYAGLVFTEVPAALALSLGLRLARRAQPGPTEGIAVGLAAAALPWLNVRYALLAGIVVLHALWCHRRARDLTLVLAPSVLSLAGLLLFHHWLYGFWNPGRVYGRHPELALATLPEGLPGLLLDQEFGLLVYAPILVLALPGFVQLLRRDRPLALATFVSVAVLALTAGSWPMWRGGFNPPGRFLVPVAPLLLVAVALVWERRGLTTGAALLLGFSLFTGLAGAAEPQLVHRDRDGTAPLFRELSGAREWTGLLPAYVLADPDRHRLALVWAVALLAAVPWRARRASAARLAVACTGLVLAAQTAAWLSHQRTDDRDAVRLVGRAALRVPGLQLRRAHGRWSPEALGWGPPYEPHRYPAGADVGRRLPLPPGKYRLTVEGESLGRELPSLAVVSDRPGAPPRSSSSRPVPGGWEADFVVGPGERAVDLRLAGGSAGFVRAFDLGVQPAGS